MQIVPAHPHRWLQTHRLNPKRLLRAWSEWLRPLFSLRQAVFNPCIGLGLGVEAA
jgi:hypothetical protein